jgi:tetratricopeptide (TPR) repeat protein
MGWQRDLSLSHERVGDVLFARGEHERALESYRPRLVIAQRLSAADPDNTEWLRDLAVAYSKLGDVFAELRNREPALVNYRAALQISERLLTIDSTRLEWQIDVIEFNRALALLGDDAPRRFAVVATGLRKLKAENRLTPELARWLAEAEAQLAQVEAK